MKNIILSTVLLVACSFSSSAKEKNINPKLLKDLSLSLKSCKNVNWIEKAEYKQANFIFNNRVASAFYSAADNELIGFGIEFNKADLPEAVTKAISSKYDASEVGEALIFITPEGYISYFVRVHKNNKDFVLKVTPSGHAAIYAKMPAAL